MKRSAVLFAATLLVIALAVFLSRIGAPPASVDPQSSVSADTDPVPPLRLDGGVDPQRAAQFEERAPAAEELRVTVVDAAERPVAGVRVVLLRADKLQGSSTTDALGCARFPVPTSSLDLIALLGTAVVGRETVAAGRHLMQIRIGGDAAIRGYVLVDGATPGEPIPIGVRCEPHPGGPQELPASVTRQLGWRGLTGEAHYLLQTDSSGRFEVVGLRSGWRVALHPEQLLWVAEQPATVTYEAPVDGVVIRLRSRPCLRGRVVAWGSLEPVPEVTGFCELVCESGSTTTGVRCSEEGRFRVPLSCSSVESAELTLGREGFGSVRLALRSIPAVGLDLGDLVLEPTVRLRVLVRTVDGAAIPGAAVRLEGEPIELRDRTDAEGLALLDDVPLAGSHSLLVEALGFTGKQVIVDSLQKEQDAPRIVVLEPTPSLLVRLEGVSWDARRHLRIRLRSETGEPFLAGASRTPDPVQLGLGAPAPGLRRTWPQGSSPDHRVSYDYALPVEGELVIPGLDPTSRLWVELIDLSETVIAGQHVRDSDLMLRQPCVLILARRPGGVHIRLVDQLGSPIRGGTVSAGTLGLAQASTDSDGRASLGPFWAATVEVLAKAPGHAPRIVWLTTSEGVWNEEVLTLLAGRTLRVRAVDRSGSPQAIEAIIARSGGMEVGRAERLPDGSARVFDLPEGALEIHASIAGTWLQQLAADGDEALLLEVP